MDAARKWYRIAGWTSLALWCLSLALPALITLYPGYDWPPTYEYGFTILLLGWLGPAQIMPAWYANLFWLADVLRATRSRAPSLLWISVGAAIGLTGLVPFHVFWFDHQGDNGDNYPIIGTYVWLASFAPLIAAAVLGTLNRSRPEPSEP